MNFLIIILFQSFLVFAQTIPRDYYPYQSRKFLYDTGKDWESLTVFGPIRFKSITKKELKNLSPSNSFNGQIGFDIKNDFYSLHGYGHFYYNDYYGYIYPTIVNNSYQASGINTSIINGFDNHAGIGFENSWAILQIGRGKESWGAGSDIQLALSENSGTYDYFLLASDYGRLRVRYIYGFLENVQKNINRYITARGFEWTNEKTLIIGFSETVIYSGENRSFDMVI